MKSFFSVFAFILLVACSSPGDNESKSKTAFAIVTSDVYDDAKIVSTLSLGDRIELLDDSASQEIAGIKVRNVRTQDGIEGWIPAAFVSEGEPATFLNGSSVYSQPNINTTSDQRFARADFVIVIQATSGGWSQVTGRAAEKNEIVSGWVKSSLVTKDKADVSFSKFYQKSLSITDPLKRAEAFQQMMIDPEFSQSVLREKFMSESVIKD